MKERFERLEETLQIVQQFWSDDDGPYVGKHYQLAETICVPQPIQQPHPPIVIGGAGEKKTLQLVAQYADACNIIADSPEVVAHKLEVLRAHCDDVGRDYGSIELTLQGGGFPDVHADPDAFLAAMEQYAALGIEHIHLRAPAPDPLGYVQRFGESLAARVSEIEVPARGGA